MVLSRSVSASATVLGQQDVLDPHGKGAADAAWLLWVLIAIAAFVVVVVSGLVIASAVRSGRARRHEAEPLTADDSDAGTFSPGTVDAHPNERSGLRLVVGAGLVFPVVVLAAVFGISIGPLRNATHHSPKSLRIDVVAHRWWWDVEYPDEGIRIANELHVPKDRDVLVRLMSDDVIHSFWVPQLAGKIDTVPGKTNNVTLHATRSGTYVGKCAEFCGLQHARMRFQVVVHEPDDYDAWVARMTAPPKEPTGEALAGRQIFLGSSCVYCHAVEGTNATSHFGPDLTHIASRKTLAAGMVANTPGALAGWILDPQSVKPGNLMPPMDIPGDQLQKLLAYLETLE